MQAWKNIPGPLSEHMGMSCFLRFESQVGKTVVRLKTWWHDGIWWSQTLQRGRGYCPRNEAIFIGVDTESTLHHQGRPVSGWMWKVRFVRLQGGPLLLLEVHYNPYKWPYKWITGVILLITGRRPTLYWNYLENSRCHFASPEKWWAVPMGNTPFFPFGDPKKANFQGSQMQAVSLRKCLPFFCQLKKGGNCS